ncbi:MAG: hypothetical protein RMZ69_19365 [Nostoc sp. ChiQUE01a]|nr:hypothetical protein [Nostoc sp. ChiQUE01a]
MNFYTVILRQISGYWVALCLENCICNCVAMSTTGYAYASLISQLRSR